MIICLAIIGILALAFFIRKAIKNTPFERKCPCAPNVHHLKRLEDAAPEHEKYKKENLW